MDLFSLNDIIRIHKEYSNAIGVAHPTSIMIDTFGTGKIDDGELVDIM